MDDPPPGRVMRIAVERIEVGPWTASCRGYDFARAIRALAAKVPDDQDPVGDLVRIDRLEEEPVRPLLRACPITS